MGGEPGEGSSAVDFLLPALLQLTADPSAAGRGLRVRVRDSPACLRCLAAHVQRAAGAAVGCDAALARRSASGTAGARGEVGRLQRELATAEWSLADGCTLLARALESRNSGSGSGKASTAGKSACGDAVGSAASGDDSSDCLTPAWKALCGWGGARCGAMAAAASNGAGSGAPLAVAGGAVAQARRVAACLTSAQLQPRAVAAAAALLALLATAPTGGAGPHATHALPLPAAPSPPPQGGQPAEQKTACQTVAWAILVAAACELLESREGASTVADAEDSEFLDWADYGETTHDLVDGMLLPAATRLVERCQAAGNVCCAMLAGSPLVAEVAAGAGGGSELLNLQLLLTTLNALAQL